jgi:hypothetical protein
LSSVLVGCGSIPRINTYDTRWVIESVKKEEKSLEVISYSRCYFAYVDNDVLEADFKKGVCILSNDALIFQNVRKIKDIPGDSEFTLEKKVRFDNKMISSAGYVEFKNLFAERAQIQLKTNKGIIALYFEEENSLTFDNKYAKWLFDHYKVITPIIDNHIVEIKEIYRPNLFIYGGTSKDKKPNIDIIQINNYQNN